MSKRWLIPLFILIACGASLHAGDVASFVNLGFSPDGSCFQFGEYGVGQADGRAYAEIYTVDTARNAFVPGGVLKSSASAALDLGQDGSGALYDLLYDNAALAKAKKIDHLRQGRLLYILLDGVEVKDELSFRDFKTGSEYSVSIKPSVTERDGQVLSSFSLDLSVRDSAGSTVTLHGGSPEVRRSGVEGYLIRRVILAPGDRYLVVLVEKKTRDGDGSSVRYMVETFKIK